MEIATVLASSTRNHGRHPATAPPAAPGHCKMNLQWMGYSYMKITTVYANSMRTIPSQAS